MSALSLSHFLRERMAVLRISNTDAAKRANISRPTWYRLLNADISEAKLTTIVKLAAALETHPMVLLRLYFTESTFSASHQTRRSHCKYASGFVADVTYPINSTVFAGETFTKIWRVINLGRQAWKGMFLQCIDSSQKNSRIDEFLLQPQSSKIVIEDTPPGGTTELAVMFKAPNYPSTIISEWKIANSEGVIEDSSFGVLRCVVKVISL